MASSPTNENKTEFADETSITSPSTSEASYVVPPELKFPVNTSQNSTVTNQSKAPRKFTILFKAVGNAPILKQKFFEVESSKTIAAIHLFLRKILHINASESLYVYVNSSFCPTLEHTIEQLCQCFGNPNEFKLTLQYSIGQAWG